MFKLLIRRFLNWLRPSKAKPEVQDLFMIERVEEEPQKVEVKVVYVVGEHGHEWVAILRCPCGCSDVIRLNLLRFEDRPTWKVEPDFNMLATIVPSIWRNVSCRSHFVIKSGRILWCK